MPISPSPLTWLMAHGHGTGRLGAAKAAASHAILSRPMRADQRSPGSAVTKGQPTYLFGPNHDGPVSVAQGQRPGLWHRFNRATRHQQALWSCKLKTQTRWLIALRGGHLPHLCPSRSRSLCDFAKSRTNSGKYRIRSPLFFHMLWSEVF